MLKPEPLITMLKQHAERLRNQKIATLFAHDPARFTRFSVQAEGVLLDYSKNLLDAAALSVLEQLAAPLADWQAQMRNGAKINLTEQRAALHIALRHPHSEGYAVDQQNLMPAVHATLAQMQRFAEQVRQAEWLGHTGLPITDIVNIGIGGSDLGPRLAYQALRPFQQKSLRMHFVANVDALELEQVFEQINPAQTVFIIVSKTFTTRETMLNAHTVRQWFLQYAPESAIAQHFVAVSTNLEAVQAFGISAENTFGFWDWVGGRYSVWSAVGLALMLAIGAAGFKEFLAGAQAIDEHFFAAPALQNLPVMLALIGFWNRSILGYDSLCIAPYHSGLRHLPAYLQQLEMESNGKQVQRNGIPAALATAPVIWGQVGSDAQHAYFQFLHQGTHIVPVDFIAVAQAEHQHIEHQRVLLANCLAQAEALMNGRPFDQVLAESETMLKLNPTHHANPTTDSSIEAWTLARHRHCPGNRPSNTLLLTRLTPNNLGKLLALYEHKVFVQSMLWNLNAFDQWGVELGKTLAHNIERELAGQINSDQHDSSTSGLLTYCQKLLH